MSSKKNQNLIKGLTLVISMILMLGTIVAVKLSMIYGLVTYLFFAAFII